MTERIRFVVLAALGLTLLAAFTLGIGLEWLEFQPGKPFVGGGQASPPVEAVPGTAAAAGWQIAPFAQGIAALLFVLLVLYLAVNLIRAVDPKKLIKIAAGMAASLGLIWLLARISPTDSTSPTTAEPSYISEPPVFDYAVTPLGEPPRSLVWLVILAVCAAAAGLCLWFFLRRRGAPEPLDRVLEEAESALHALQNGENLRNVIVRCYLQMVAALQEGRGIEREPAVTPHEFVSLLVDRGLPAGPIRQLTGLFESVRYGARPVSELEERQALECLNAIIAACREDGQR